MKASGKSLPAEFDDSDELHCGRKDRDRYVVTNPASRTFDNGSQVQQ